MGLEVGVEPTWPVRARDFESRASASSAIPAWAGRCGYIQRRPWACTSSLELDEPAARVRAICNNVQVSAYQSDSVRSDSFVGREGGPMGEVVTRLVLAVSACLPSIVPSKSPWFLWPAGLLLAVFLPSAWCQVPEFFG